MMIVIFHTSHIPDLPNYSSREAPSHKIGSAFLFFDVLLCRFALWTLIGSRPDDTYFSVVDHVLGKVHLKNKMSTSDVCFALLYGLFV